MTKRAPLARRSWAFLTRHGWFPLAALLAAATLAWGFAELADDVGEGDTRAFDEWVLARLGGAALPAWVRYVARDVTALGGYAVLSLVTVGVAGFLAAVRRWGATLLVLASVLGGFGLSTLLKLAFDRDRPPLAGRLDVVHTASFPSGHSLLATATYVTLGVLLAGLVKRPRLKAYLIGAAVFVSVLVGVSRVVLSVHWATDVLAGWTAGLAWGLVCYAVERLLQRAEMVEPESDGVST